MNNKTRAVINILRFNLIFNKSFQSFSLDNLKLFVSMDPMNSVENQSFSFDPMKKMISNLPMKSIESFYQNLN